MSARWSDPRTIAGAVAGWGRVVVDALRILGRSWPQLLALLLAGACGRQAAIWAATYASRTSPLLPVLILPLAPVATLLALVLALRVAARDLPAFGPTFLAASPGRVWRSHLGVAAKSIVPFLALYAAQGLLGEDSRRYIVDAMHEEVLRRDLFAADWGRTVYVDASWGFAAVIIGVIGLRTIITRRTLAERSAWWAALAGYLEATWMVSLAAWVASKQGEVTDWVMSRRVAVDFVDWVHRSLGILGDVGAAISGFLGWLGTTIGAMGAWLVVPVAWLAVGAVALGSNLGDVTDPLPVPSREQLTERLEKIPRPVRRVAAKVAEPVTTPFTQTVTALRRVAVAGLAPMLLFCAVFVLASQLPVAVTWLVRLLAGPTDMGTHQALTPYLELAQRTVLSLAIVVLLAAAVNTVVLAQRARAAADEADAMAAAQAEAQPTASIA